MKNISCKDSWIVYFLAASLMLIALGHPPVARNISNHSLFLYQYSNATLFNFCLSEMKPSTTKNSSELCSFTV